MTKKEQITEALNAGKTIVEEYNAKRGEIDTDNTLSEEGRNIKKVELTAQYNDLLSAKKEEAINALEEIKEEKKKSNKELFNNRVKDAGYQVAVQNAVAAIRAGAATSEDVQNYVETFAGDQIALNMFRDAAAGNNKLAALIPVDSREEEAALFAEIRSTINKLFTPLTVFSRPSAPGVYLNMFEKMVMKHFDDNMEYTA